MEIVPVPIQRCHKKQLHLCTQLTILLRSTLHEKSAFTGRQDLF